ncbi:vitamin B12-dependent ribonucleotide reductase [Myxococcus xanthus]|uniref:vitamin B12-dependent ribonucleotide reductase n=1 Tax=Myxococcus xanthus TaxID=34 RepID=UPI00112BC6C4|nr:vitamin B12-dependent ribonucleotide reductase [Myxococcus xanthus]QDE82607.1 ribonucleoside-diphosphate reductase, adenosylcobalamin-dependent [Myxococcus xanthus]QDE96877.1 ribonucleoside-diphosphate reductase, adenosylcobalamin-dependent [Myxococcus xanthus]QDF04408.1 ribonucleoside-diphosphate reductase, adenosylcobalamin-dependent [Myxococcus xanthus]
MDKELSSKSTVNGKERRGGRKARVAATGLTVERFFTTPGVDPADELAWEYRSASITGEDGKAVFEQKNIEVPKSWSMLATNVVASKYFRGTPGTPERETSVRKLVARVVDTLTRWGVEGGYFTRDADREAFHAELTHLLLRQKASFNSPVWFNVGVEAQPQCSACFINSVEDNMDSILTLARTEGMLFKYGSGTGSNLSTIRGSKELLAGGGTASGPVSFMRGFDAFAGVIKSGGKTRRAAKMVILNAEHPDILEFIRCKSTEEKKAWALIEAGYDPSFNGEAYSSVFFQNSNNSVRVTDAFMKAVVDDATWTTRSVRDGQPLDTYQARELFREISEAAHLCGDPGMQFDTTVNSWHTCSTTARINASNPCSEYMFLDDSACNLASLNLMHFRTIDGDFDVTAFRHAVDILLMAQEIIVGNSRYPTERIEKNSHDYRPLGLGYANLGALLMASGLPYDSPAGRNYAGAITSLMCGEAYAMSARLAEKQGPFAGYAKNAEPMLGVIRKHRKAAYHIAPEGVSQGLFAAQKDAWDRALALGEEHGFRNSQVTVLAPTGTIGFMMDCDTTGIEPDIALIKYKKLVGGGMLKIVNQTVPLALEKLGYPQTQSQDIISYLDKQDTIEGAPHLKPEHLPVFDCAFKPAQGERSIHWMGHIQMMEACQPFLSGAISKTVNMPSDATVEDIEKAYLEAWKRGLKAIAVYRDGCKRTQPLNTSKETVKDTRAAKSTVAPEPAPAVQPEPRAVRRRLPDERRSITHKFSIGGHEGYLTVGMYEDGLPGELFIVMAKEGSVVSGLMDSFATSVSLALQYGVPLKVLVDKLSHTRFEPSGFTGNPDIPIAKSITDYIFRWLELKFLPSEEEDAVLDRVDVQPKREALPAQTASVQRSDSNSSKRSTWLNQADAPPCHTCGAIMVRSGACYKCGNCGATSGCS